MEGYDEQPDSDLFHELYIGLTGVESMLGNPKSIIDVTFTSCLICACLNLGQEYDVNDHEAFENSETDKSVTLITDLILDDNVEGIKKLVEKHLVINQRFEVILSLQKENML